MRVIRRKTRHKPGNATTLSIPVNYKGSNFGPIDSTHILVHQKVKTLKKLCSSLKFNKPTNLLNVGYKCKVYERISADERTMALLMFTAALKNNKSLLQYMISYFVNKNVKSSFLYNLLMNIYKWTRDHKRMVRLWELQKEHQYLINYPDFMRLFEMNGIKILTELLIQLWDDMIKHHVKPTFQDYVILFRNHSTTPPTHYHTSRNTINFREYVSKLMKTEAMDSRSTLISFFSVFASDETNSFQISDMLIISGKQNKLEQLWNWWYKSSGNINQYNAMLYALGINKCYTDIYNIRREMVEQSIYPNLDTFNLLLAIYGEKGDYPIVKYVFGDMKKFNVTANNTTYKILLMVYWRLKKYFMFIKLWNEIMNNNQLTPDIISGMYKVYNVTKWREINKIGPSIWTNDRSLWDNILSEMFNSIRLSEEEVNEIRRELGIDINGTIIGLLKKITMPKPSR
eukprot:TRINITY_DN9464_c0_g1_i1.p1 TRINITY_DN9464_c0_g1~~TRINITY_DN9464_c0_g1_i1.p1  ORF type:complete len:457 (-),score=52.45 TRINITY_DN9464_c0_g1_i1:31-1401(-)